MFLDIGQSPSLFWTLSLSEATDMVESHNRREAARAKEEESKLKADIVLNSVLAKQIGEHVACVLGAADSITPLHALFPELFKEEQQQEDKLLLYKAQMEDYAFRHNTAMEKRGED